MSSGCSQVGRISLALLLLVVGALATFADEIPSATLGVAGTTWISGGESGFSFRVTVGNSAQMGGRPHIVFIRNSSTATIVKSENGGDFRSYYIVASDNGSVFVDKSASNHAWNNGTWRRAMHPGDRLRVSGYRSKLFGADEHIGTIEVVFVEDSEPPYIESTVYGPYTEESVDIELKAYDTLSGISSSTLTRRFSGEGVHLLDVTLTDRVGNKRTERVSTTIDLTPPDLVIQANTYENPQSEVMVTGVVSDSVYGAGDLTVSYRTDGAAWSWLGPEQVESDGSFTITATENGFLEVRAEDPAGWQTTQTIEITQVDTAGPVIDFDESWSAEETRTALAVDDGSGVDSSSWKYRFGPEGNPWIDGEAISVSIEGETELWISVADLTGNVTEGEFVVRYDATKPTLAPTFVSPGGYVVGAWTSEASVTVQPNAFDTTSGIDELQYSIDGGEYVDASVGRITVSDEGETQLSLIATDLAGNSASLYIPIRIDQTAPTLASMRLLDASDEVVQPNEYVRSASVQAEIRLAPEGSDAAPIASILYDVVSGGRAVDSAEHLVAPSDWADPQTLLVQLPVPGTGEFVFEFRVADEAGNVSEPAREILLVDQAIPNPPRITSTTHGRATFTGGTITGSSNRRDASFEFAATSAGPSGVAGYNYSLVFLSSDGDRSPVYDRAGFSESGRIVINGLEDNEPGELYSVRVTAIAASGAESSSSSYEFAVDTEPPRELTLTLSPHVDSSTWYNRQFTDMSWNEPLDLSGVKRYGYRLEAITETEATIDPDLPSDGEPLDSTWLFTDLRAVTVDLHQFLPGEAGVLRALVAAEDGAGNREFDWQLVRVDNVPPEFSEPVEVTESTISIAAGSFALTWGVATDPGGSGIVSHYTVDLTVLDGDSLVQARPQRTLQPEIAIGNAFSVEFNGLPSEAVYVATVSAVDSAGNVATEDVVVPLTTEVVTNIRTPFRTLINGFEVVGSSLPDGSGAKGTLSLPPELQALSGPTADPVESVELESVVADADGFVSASVDLDLRWSVIIGGHTVTIGGLVIDSVSGISLTEANAQIASGQDGLTIPFESISVGPPPSIKPISSSTVQTDAVAVDLFDADTRAWRARDINELAFVDGLLAAPVALVDSQAMRDGINPIESGAGDAAVTGLPVTGLRFSGDQSAVGGVTRGSAGAILRLSSIDLELETASLAGGAISIARATALLGPGYEPERIELGNFALLFDGTIEMESGFFSESASYTASDGTHFELQEIGIGSDGLVSDRATVTTPGGRKLQFEGIAIGSDGVDLDRGQSLSEVTVSVHGYVLTAQTSELHPEGYLLINPRISEIPSEFGSEPWVFDSVGIRFSDDSVFSVGIAVWSGNAVTSADIEVTFDSVIIDEHGVHGAGTTVALPDFMGGHLVAAGSMQLHSDGTLGGATLTDGAGFSLGGWQAELENGRINDLGQLIVDTMLVDLSVLGAAPDTPFGGLVSTSADVIEPAVTEVETEAVFGDWNLALSELSLNTDGLSGTTRILLPNTLGGITLDLAGTTIETDGTFAIGEQSEPAVIWINGFRTSVDGVLLSENHLGFGEASVVLFEIMGGGTLLLEDVVVTSAGIVLSGGSPLSAVSFTSTTGFFVQSGHYTFDQQSIVLGGSVSVPGEAEENLDFGNGAIRLYPDGTISTLPTEQELAWQVDDWIVSVTRSRYERSHWVVESSMLSLPAVGLALELPEMEVWADGAFKQPGLLAQYLDAQVFGFYVGGNRATFDEEGLRFSAFIELPTMFDNAIVYFDEVDLGGDGSIKTDGIVPYLPLPFGEFGNAALWNVSFSDSGFRVGEGIITISLPQAELVTRIRNFWITSEGVFFDNASVEPFELWGMDVYIDGLSSDPDKLAFHGAVRLPRSLDNKLAGRLLRIDQFEVGWQDGLRSFNLTLDGELRFPLTEDEKWVATVTDLGTTVESDPFKLLITMDEAGVEVPSSLGVGDDAKASVVGLSLDVTSGELDWTAVQLTDLERELYNTTFRLDRLALERSGRAILQGSAVLPADLVDPFGGATLIVHELEVLPGGGIGNISASATGLSDRLFDSLLLQNGTLAYSHLEGVSRIGVGGTIVFDRFPEGIQGKEATIDPFVINVTEKKIEEFAAEGGPFTFDLGGVFTINEAMLGVAYSSTTELFDVSGSGSLILPNGLPEFLRGQAVDAAFEIDSAGQIHQLLGSLRVNDRKPFIGGIEIENTYIEAEYQAEADRYLYATAGTLVFSDTFPEGVAGTTITLDRFEFDSDGNLSAISALAAIDNFDLFGTVPILDPEVSLTKVPGNPLELGISATSALPESFPEGLAGAPVRLDEFRFSTAGELLAFRAIASDLETTLFAGLTLKNGSIGSVYTGADEFLFSVGGEIEMPDSLGPMLGDLTLGIDAFDISTTRGVVAFEVSSAQPLRHELFHDVDLVISNLALSESGVGVTAVLEFGQSYPEGLRGVSVGVDEMLVAWDGEIQRFSAGLDYLVIRPAGFSIEVVDLVVTPDGVALGSATLALPENMAELAVSLENAGIDNQGNFYGEIGVSDIGFTVAEFELRFEDPDLDFEAQRISFSRSMVKAPEFVGSAEFEVYGLSITPAGMQVSGGEFSLPDFTLPGGMGFRDVYVGFALGEDGTYFIAGGGAATLPGVGTLAAEISFTNRSELYPIGLKRAFFSYEASGLGLALGATGMYINGIRGGIAFGPPDEVPAAVQGLFGNGMRIQLGLTMQDATFGRVVRGDVDTWVDLTDWDWAIQGDVTVLQGMLRADLLAALSPSKGFYGRFGVRLVYVRGSIEVYVFEYQNSTRINGEGRVSIGVPKGTFLRTTIRFWRWRKTIYFPGRDWWFGSISARLGTFSNNERGVLGTVRFRIFGRTRHFSVFVPRGNGRVRVVNANSYRLYRPPWLSVRELHYEAPVVSAEFTAWDSPHMSVSEQSSAGAHGLEVDGSGDGSVFVSRRPGVFEDVQLFDVPAAAREVGPLSPLQARSLGDGGGSATSQRSPRMSVSSEPLDAPSDTDWLMVVVGYAEAIPTIVLVAPDGTRYDTEDERIGVEYDESSIILGIDKPMAGQWSIEVSNVPGPDYYEVEVYGFNEETAVTVEGILQPRTPTSGVVTVTGTAVGSALEGNTAMLYVHEEPDGPGRAVNEAQVSNGLYAIAFDTTSLANGEYWVSVAVDGDDGYPVVGTAQGSLLVANAAQVITPVDAVMISEVAEGTVRAVIQDSVDSRPFGYMARLTHGDLVETFEIGNTSDFTLPGFDAGSEVTLEIAPIRQDGLPAAFTASNVITIGSKAQAPIALAHATVELPGEITTYVGEEVTLNVSVTDAGTTSGAFVGVTPAVAGIQSIVQDDYVSFTEHQTDVSIRLYASEELGPGSYPVTLTLVSAANRNDQISATFMLRVRQPIPVVDDVEPREWVNSEPIELTIAGKGFIPGTRVFIGDTELVVEERLPFSMVVTAPSGVPHGEQQLAVVSPAGDSRTATVIVERPQYLLSLPADRIVVSKGLSTRFVMRLYGENGFNGTLGFEIDDAPDGITASVTDSVAVTQEAVLILTVGQNVSTGTDRIVLRLSDGTRLTIPVTIVDGELAPTITALSEESVTHGDELEIYGYGFGSEGSVALAGALLPIVSYSSDTIVVTIPSSAESGSLTVRSEGVDSAPAELIVFARRYVVAANETRIALQHGEQREIDLFVSGNVPQVDLDVSTSHGALVAELADPSIVPNGRTQLSLQASGAMATGIYQVFVHADASGIQQGLSIEVAIGDVFTIATEEVAAGIVGVPYEYRLQTANGEGVAQFELSEGALPKGLALSTAGRIHGEPIAAETSTVTILATDALGREATAAFTITVEENAWGHSSSNTGRTRHNPVALPARPDLLWESVLFSEGSTVLTGGNRVYVVAESGVSFLDQSTGAFLFRVPGSVLNAFYESETLFIHTSETFGAYDPASATMRWQRTGITAAESDGGLLYLRGKEGVQAVRSSDGTLAVNELAPENLSGELVAWYGGKRYSTEGTELTVWTAANGETEAIVLSAEPVALAVDADGIVIADDSGNVQLLTHEHELTVRRFVGYERNELTITRDYVVAAGVTGMSVLSRDDLTLNSDNRETVETVASGNEFIVAGNASALSVVNRHRATPIWSIPQGVRSIAVSVNTLYAYASDGRVRAYRGPSNFAAPVAEFAVTPADADGTNGWYQSRPTIDISATDPETFASILERRIDGQSWQSVTEPFSLSDGNTHLSIRAVDSNGLTGETRTRQFRVDATPPVMESTADYIGGVDDIVLSTVTITAEATDATSGVSSLLLSEDGGDYEPFYGSISISEEGPIDLQWTALDAAGNMATARSLSGWIDLYKPMVYGVVNIDGMTAWVNISADDGPSGSGVQRIEVRIDGGEPTEYDAPIALGRSTRRTVEFRAIDRAGRTSDWSTLWVQPSSSDDPTEHLVTAINAGGGAYQSMEGVPFEADQHYIGGKDSQKGNAHIANTYDDPLYRSYRTGSVHYEIPVPNGNYRVRLHFAEMYHTEAGQRVMDVRVEDEVVDAALDVYGEVGYRAALILEARVRVIDGSLKVEARGIEKHPNISAIVVERDDPMQGTLYAINAGGPAAVDSEGIRYNADSQYTGGHPQSGEEFENSTLETRRVGTFRYSLPVENGTYQVVLTTAVDQAAERGQNIYTVRAEHKVPVQSVDLASEYAGQESAQHRFHVEVTDGILNLSFEPEQGDASLSAIQVREADPMADVAYAINIGGGAYVASDGIRYAPDAYHQGGKTNRRPRDIANTIDDILYHSYRGGTFRYELPVTNGVYEVEFHFDENFYHEEGQRAFDARAEHHLVYNNLDVVAETGRKSAALVMRYQVVVRDGALSLHFIADRKDAIASAIVVRRGDPMFDVHHAVNLGGERFRNADGVLFAADTEQASLGLNQVEGTYDDKLFQSGRIGATVVTVELAPGPYHVSLGAVAPPVNPDGDLSATITATADGKPLLEEHPLAPMTATVGSADLLLHDGELSLGVVTDKAASTFLLIRTGDPMTGVHHAINAGGGSYLASDGIRFEPDKHYEGGKEADRRNTIAGTEDDAIYQSWRSGSSTYTLPVTPGRYEVELHFVETYFSEGGQREFSVVVDGQLFQIDIARAVGRNAAHVVNIPVATLEEQIVISVQSGRRDANISALVVREAE